MNEKSKSSLAYISLTEVTMIIFTLIPFIQDVPKRVLSYNAWIPYDYTSPIGFWFAYMHQAVAHAYGASINAAFDTLIPSMMMSICCQFSILQHRFKILPDVINKIKKYDKTKSGILEAKKFGECVEHHLQIYQLSIILIIFNSL